jgi:glucokinase-like ROK family protein
MLSSQGDTRRRIPISSEEEALIELILRPGTSTRTTLARDLELSPAWITKTITPLIEREIIIETGSAAQSSGRRARTLGFHPDVGMLLGVDFGATHLDIALAGPDLRIVARRSAVLNIADGPDICLATLFGMVDEVLREQKLSIDQIRGVGVGVPGPVDFARGRLTSPPIMPGWDDFPLPETLMAQIPNAFVMVDNDVNLMALGERYHGQGRSAGNFIYVKVGSGIGAGIVVSGQLYRGSSGCAGEIGHIIVDRGGPVCHCGNHGCVEALAGGQAISRQAQGLAEDGSSPKLAELLRTGGGLLTAVDVGAAAAQGDQAALALIDQSGRYVGEMLTYLVYFFNPDLILVGGGVSQIGNRFLNAIRQTVLAKANPLATRALQIEYSPLGREAGVLGALTLAQQSLFYVPVVGPER